MEKENAIDFLLYSYFAVTTDSEDEKLLYAAADRAYRDAASRVLSISTAYEGKKKALRDSGCQLLVRFLQQLPIDDYDTSHKNLCNELRNIYKKGTNGEYNLTYGIAQKWVNMTMKYIFILSALIDNTGFSSNYADKLPENTMHIPLDSYMLEYIAQKNGDKFAVSPCIKIPTKGENTSKTFYSSEKSLAWSKYRNYEDEYMNVQKKLREKLGNTCGFPLDWECKAWLEVAKNRNSSNKSK